MTDTTKPAQDGHVELNESKVIHAFGGRQMTGSHASSSTGTDMALSVYTPPGARADTPVVIYLSGLTCTEQNVTTKGGFQRTAAELGLIIVCADTSPRGDDVADDEGWDLGKGAGFYVDATQAPWQPHYQMWRYISEDLPALIRAEISSGPLGITGHSMGGHGALIAGLKRPDLFKSVSAFAPICHPSDVAWGRKAFGAYLGSDRAAWAAYDATALLESGATHPASILIDQGLADGFLNDQLRPGTFAKAAEDAGQGLTLRMHAGYDHSYYFVASFMADHLAHHAQILLRSLRG